MRRLMFVLCLVGGLLCIVLPPVFAAQDRALFVSLIQDPPVLTSRKAMEDMIGLAKQGGIKILFIQVYRANEAWFPTKAADSMPYRKAVKKLSQDPLKLLITLAHRQGLEVHAWLNLLSLSKNTNAPILKKYGPEILTRNLEEKKAIEDYQIDHQYFLEPGDPRVAADLAQAVEDLVRRYPDLDGIQFDYIRYPDTNPHYGYTQSNMTRFRKATGFTTIDEKSQVWQDWRRRQVTRLLTQLVKTVRDIRPKIKISTTGCMPYVRAYYEAYQDWPSWISSGLVDFVTVMSYAPQLEEFNRTVKAARDKVSDPSRMKIAVGAYKFIDAPQIFEEELRSCESMSKGCAIFHYGSLLESPQLRDIVTNKNP